MPMNQTSTIMVDKVWPQSFMQRPFTPPPFSPKPQVRDLPRDGHIDVTCQSCRRQWRNSVRHMVEHERLGAQFVDLLEWQSRCACGGTVCFAVDDSADVRHAA